MRIFGKHSIAIPTITPLFTILARQFEDSNVMLLTQAATLYLIVSTFGNGKGENANGYMISLTIYAGLLFACSMAGFCDWIKERQHLQLKDEINNQKVTVYRGAFGTVQSVPVRELVVGDIVDINQGDRVPADCILIDEMNITVDQSMYYPRDTKKDKESSVHTPNNNEHGVPEGDQDNHKGHPDPFLFSDSKIMTGQGKAIVCAVGDHTLMALNRKAGDLQINEQLTFLEEKLDMCAKNIGTYAMFAAITIFLTQLLFNLVFIMASDTKKSYVK